MYWDPVCRWFVYDDGAIVTEQWLTFHNTVTDEHRRIADRDTELWVKAFEDPVNGAVAAVRRAFFQRTK